jgi:hypothetical protein
VNLQRTFFLTVQHGDITAEVQCCQLLIYSWFVDDAAVKDEMLFSKALETASYTSHSFASFCLLSRKWSFSWEKLVSICADDASVMLGCHSRFMVVEENIQP